jgi:lysine 2,3-aminomutase
MKKYHLINSLEKLEALIGKEYRNIDRTAFSKLIFDHPLRFTDYLLEQIKYSPAIAKQYLPDPRELDPIGLEKPFTGVMTTGIPGLERMYLDRVILMPTSQCFAYCRFCFRKNYSHDARKGDYGTPQESFQKAIDYIINDPRIKEVLITGGDPLMFPEKVIELCKQLRQIPHLTGIRIGSRIFTSDPELITSKWIKPFKVLNTVKLTNYRFVIPTEAEESLTHSPISSLPAPISLSPHINHPDELSPQTIKSLLLCTQNRVPLYNQTVLLKGINDDPEVLIELFRKLRQLGVEPYRVYHADPLKGTEHFRISLDRFMEIKRTMRAQASGRIVPSFIIDTRIGKVELGADADIVKRKENTVWIKTPFTEKIYRSVNPKWRPPDGVERSDDGFLIVPYADALIPKTAKHG